MHESRSACARPGYRLVAGSSLNMRVVLLLAFAASVHGQCYEPGDFDANINFKKYQTLHTDSENPQVEMVWTDGFGNEFDGMVDVAYPDGLGALNIRFPSGDPNGILGIPNMVNPQIIEDWSIYSATEGIYKFTTEGVPFPDGHVRIKKAGTIVNPLRADFTWTDANENFPGTRFDILIAVAGSTLKPDIADPTTWIQLDPPRDYVAAGSTTSMRIDYTPPSTITATMAAMTDAGFFCIGMGAQVTQCEVPAGNEEFEFGTPEVDRWPNGAGCTLRVNNKAMCTLGDYNSAEPRLGCNDPIHAPSDTCLKNVEAQCPVLLKEPCACGGEFEDCYVQTPNKIPRPPPPPLCAHTRMHYNSGVGSLVRRFPAIRSL